MDFQSVDWGPDEAKGDPNLSRYFVKIPQYDGLVSGRYRYVIGRKGTGKTALAERLRVRLSGVPTAFQANLSLRSFPVPILEQLKQVSLIDKSQYVSVWKFLLAVELARMVLLDQGAGPRETISELDNFLESNFPHGRSGFAQTLELLREREAKVSVSPSFLGGILGRKRTDRISMSVSYHEITEVLLETLGSIRSNSDYHIMMDELDEGYVAGDAKFRLILLGLLRATEDSFLQLQRSGFRFRPLVLLRSDIFDRLEDNDINKLDDYVVRLKWYSDTNQDFSLARIVDARIRASLKLEGSNLWGNIADDEDRTIPRNVGSLWKYVTNRTFERPRDIIKFMKTCTRFQPVGKLAFSAVEQAEYQFSDWLYRELGNELHSYLPPWREALQCITRIGRRQFGVGEYVAELKQDSGVRRWLETGHDPEEIPSTLFEFGILGNKDRSRWLFKYKDDDIAWNSKMMLTVHFGLLKKLRVTS